MARGPRHLISDIDFVSGNSSRLRPQIIYLYLKASGVLRTKVLARVIEIAKPGEYELTWVHEGCLRTELTTMSSLFGCRFILGDLAKLSSQEGGKAKVEDGLELIASGRARNRAFLMASVESVIPSLSSWQGAINRSTFIVERLVAPENLKGVLNYLIKTSDLSDFGTLVRRKNVLEMVKKFVSERPRTLLELMQHADVAVLTEIDSSGSGLDEKEKRRAPIERTRLVLPQRLDAFLDRKDERALIELLRLLDERYSKRGVKTDVLIRRLYEATSSLLEKKDARRSGSRRGARAKSDLDPRLRGQLCWACRLLTWEKRLREGNFIVAAEKLCRDFLRVSEDGEHALDEFWQDIALQLIIVEDLDSSKLAEARVGLRIAIRDRLAEPGSSALFASLQRLHAISDDTTRMAFSRLTDSMRQSLAV